MKICEKSNYKFIKNISKSYIYLVKDYQEGVKIFYENMIEWLKDILMVMMLKILRLKKKILILII